MPETRFYAYGRYRLFGGNGISCVPLFVVCFFSPLLSFREERTDKKEKKEKVRALHIVPTDTEYPSAACADAAMSLLCDSRKYSVLDSSPYKTRLSHTCSLNN